MFHTVSNPGRFFFTKEEQALLQEALQIATQHYNNLSISEVDRQKKIAAFTKLSNDIQTTSTKTFRVNIPTKEEDEL